MDNGQNALQKLDAATRMLAEVETVDDAKKIVNLAEAARVYARQVGLGIKAQNHAAEIKLRAQRKGGEILAKMIENGQRHNGRGNNCQVLESQSVIPKLDSLGITPNDSSRWQRVASVPVNEFEKFISETRDAEDKLTTAAILREIKMPHVANNSGNNEWYTPPEYIEAARSVLGSIDLDPASSIKANEIIKARKFYTIEDDGLIKRWRGKVWMNPPYAADLIGKFTSKLCEHVRSGDISEAIVLVNNATEAEWFEDMAALASTILFTFRRVKFLNDNLEPRGAPLQGQSLLYFGPNYKKFIAAFSNLAWAVNHGKH